MDNERLIDAIEECLRHYDPQGLIAFGAPRDEYHHEAEMIAEGFLALPTKFVIQQKVYSVFSKQFSPSVAGSFSSYEPIAEDLFNLQHTFGKTYKVR